MSGTARCLVVMWVAALAQPALAATFTVNDIADLADINPGDGTCDGSSAAGAQCTLRAAVIEANAWAGSDVIEVVPGTTYLLSLAGTDDLAATGDLDLRGDTTLQATGGAPAIINANFIDRVLQVDPANGASPITVLLRNLVITGGAAQLGAGIHSSGRLALENVTIRDNRANAANAAGAGIYNLDDDLTLTSCTVNGNTFASGGPADGVAGAGLYHAGSGLSGAATVSVNASSFRANNAGNASGGGVFVQSGSLMIIDSTLGENRAGLSGGAISAGGNGTVRIVRSTFSDNVASEGPIAAANGGGALAVSGSQSLEILESVFSTNVAYSDLMGVSHLIVQLPGQTVGA